MAEGSGFRVVVFGATGALGSEVIAVLDEHRFPIRELVPVASDRSLGCDVEIGDQVLPVETEVSLRGADFLFLCAPPEPSLELAAEALRQSVPAVDLSGGLVRRDEVPLLVADVHQPPDQLGAPLLATPPGPALAWLHVLLPLHRELGLRRVVATTVEAASWGGRGGIESLSRETLALFNQRELPDPDVFGRPVAFDCIPEIGEVAPDGSTERESGLAAAVGRLLGADVAIAVQAVQMPTFSGDGTTFALETERPADPAAVTELLRKSANIELEDPERGPTTRAAAGRDEVLVGRVRSDPSRPGGLLLWVAADSLRLAAANAVRLVEARLRIH